MDKILKYLNLNASKKMDSRTIEIVQSIYNQAPNGIYITPTSKEPVKQFSFESDGSDVSSHTIANSLEQCYNEGYHALFMPELAQVRIKSLESGYKDLWRRTFGGPFSIWYLTPSAMITGKTKSGAKVVLYIHIPNYFSDPQNLREIRYKLKNGAGPMPQDSFNELVAQEGNGRVFLVDYDKARSFPTVYLGVENLLEHPQTIPFFGGEEIAKAHLAKHKEFYSDRIMIHPIDDLRNDPFGRLLTICDNTYGGTLDDVVVMRNAGIFGVAQKTRP